MRLAVELAVSRLPAREALPLLHKWAQHQAVLRDSALSSLLGEQLLCLLLVTARDGEEKVTDADMILQMCADLLPEDTRPGLVAELLGVATPGGAKAASSEPSSDPLMALWSAALALCDPAAAKGESWSSLLRECAGQDRLQGMVQALRVQDAAQRGDALAVAKLLDESAALGQFAERPPNFVVRAVAVLARGNPASQRLRKSIGAWLSHWDYRELGPEAGFLARYAGLEALDPRTAQPNAGEPRVAWCLHQASQAAGRQQYREALAWVQRAIEEDPDLRSVPNAPACVWAARAELERLARAEHLAAVARWLPEQPLAPAELLVDAADLLAADETGKEVLAAAEQGDLPLARQRLAELAGAVAPGSRLGHHLALIYGRAARFFNNACRPAEAETCWRLAWRCWLGVVAVLDAGGEGASAHRANLLDQLLDFHRARLHDHLGRGEMEEARRHWRLVHDVVALARQIGEGLGRKMEAATAGFRDTLATEFLTATRETVRHGEGREGWRGDYERALTALRLFLSLDHDNLRVLTALVEICSDWFHDCYHNEDGHTLVHEVERFTPFALKLARLVEPRPAELSARAALADFYKFRAFIHPDRQGRVALLREALRFNPANHNVQELLAELAPQAGREGDLP
jgi:tetratricopeptide (TPR) repeat protein